MCFWHLVYSTLEQRWFSYWSHYPGNTVPRFLHYICNDHSYALKTFLNGELISCSKIAKVIYNAMVAKAKLPHTACNSAKFCTSCVGKYSSLSHLRCVYDSHSLQCNCIHLHFSHGKSLSLLPSRIILCLRHFSRLLRAAIFRSNTGAEYWNAQGYWSHRC